MKIGLVTDTHAGLRSDERVQDSLQYLSSEFRSRGVDTVLHLGDIAHEDPIDSYPERVRQVLSVFNEFETAATLGNHDIQAISKAEFETEFSVSCDRVLYETADELVVKINTAGHASLSSVAQDTPVGVISDTARDLIINGLNNGKRVTVFTHYPLQFTEFHQEQDFFDFRPEYTFPVNKLQLEQQLLDALQNGSLQLYCGHLHPQDTTTVETRPFGVPLTIVEPVQYFYQDDTDIVWEDNLHPTVDDLIIDF